ncbi:MAG: DUF11 domain-containing protein [Blastocatellia bacterium]
MKPSRQLIIALLISMLTTSLPTLELRSGSASAVRLNAGSTQISPFGRRVQAQQPTLADRRVKRTVVNMSSLAAQPRRQPIARSRVAPAPQKPANRRNLPVPAEALRETQTRPAARPISRAAKNAPVLVSFPALEDNETVIPPDTQGAVGPFHVMTTLNSEIRIQNRVGDILLTVPLDQLAASLGIFDVFDPRLLYDHVQRRWIFVTVSGAFKADSAVQIAVSQDENPTGFWYVYSFDADSTDAAWADFPIVGFNRDWIVVTTNMFEVSNDGNPDNNFRGTQAFVITKSNLYDFLGETPRRFIVNDGFSMAPAVTYDNTLSTIWLVEDWNGQAGALRLSAVSGTVGAETLTAGIGFPIAPGGATWGDWDGDNSIQDGDDNDFLPQLGSESFISEDDARISSPAIWRNGSLWVTHHVFLPAGLNPLRTAVQWWQITPTGPVINQFGRVDDENGGNFYAYPSLAVNQNNDVLIGYSRFSAGRYASANYAFRYGTDPADTLQTDTVLRDGEGPYDVQGPPDFENRWGDYSATAVDPVNDQNLWTIQEYAAAGNHWATWWGGLILEGADLAVTKTADAFPAIAGKNLTYTIGLVNNGPDAATNVEVRDYLPAGVSLVSATVTSGTGWQVSDTKFTKSVVNNGETATFKIVVTLNSCLDQDSLLDNIVIAAGSLSDSNPDNNVAEVFTDVVRQADLAISRNAIADPVIAGTTMTYTVAVRNNGPSCALNLRISDALPAATRLISVTAPGATITGPSAGGIGTIEAVWKGETAPGTVRTLTIVVCACGEMVCDALIRNVVVTTSDSPDPNPASNSALFANTLRVDPVRRLKGNVCPVRTVTGRG